MPTGVVLVASWSRAEIQGRVVKVDLVTKQVVGYLQLAPTDAARHPRRTGRQDVLRRRHGRWGRQPPRPGRPSPSSPSCPPGRAARPLSQPRRDQALPLQPGFPSRRGIGPHGQGRVSVIDFSRRAVVANWPIPGGGGPNMGNVSADGTPVWLSGRYDELVYVFDPADRTAVHHPRRPPAPRARSGGPPRPLLPRPHGQHALTPPRARRSAPRALHAGLGGTR